MYTYLLKLWLPDMRDSCGGWNGRCRQLKALFIHSPSLSTTCLFLRSMLIESPLHAGLDLGVESKKCQECLPGSSLSEWWMEGTISWDEKAKKRAWLGEWYQQFSIGDADSETSSRYPHVAKLAAHWPVGIARRWWGGTVRNGKSSYPGWNIDFISASIQRKVGWLDEGVDERHFAHTDIQEKNISQVQSARSTRNLTEGVNLRILLFEGLFLDPKWSSNSKPNCKSCKNLRDLIMLLIPLPYFQLNPTPTPQLVFSPEP